MLGTCTAFYVCAFLISQSLTYPPRMCEIQWLARPRSHARFCQRSRALRVIPAKAGNLLLLY